MKVLARGLVAIIIIVGIAAGVSSWLSSGLSSKQNQNSSATQSPLPTPSSSPSLHYPVTAETDLPQSNSKHLKAVPHIDDSDQSVEEMLSELIGKEKFERLFTPTNIIRRIVVTVESAGKHNQISQEFSPFLPLDPGFLVQKKGDVQSIDSNNYKRYLPYAELARTIDIEGLVNVYVHFYPLFQSAYEDLGSRGYFNDRLIGAIDILLKSPEVREPILVSRVGTHNLYRYNDDQLEALPASQKIMVRMGSENSTIIKTRLREIRNLLIHLDKTKKK